MDIGAFMLPSILPIRTSFVGSAANELISLFDITLPSKTPAFITNLSTFFANSEITFAGETGSSASTTTAVGLPVYTSTTVSVGLAAQALALLSDQAANPIIVMNKATWGDFKAAQYANKFSVDPFEGLDVEFNNTIPSFTAATTGDTYMIVGDFAEGAIANFPNGEDITIKVDDKTDMTKDLVRVLGRQYVGLGIVGPNAFVRIQK